MTTTTVYLRIQFILSEGLQDPGRPHQARDGAADGRREAAAVDEVAGAGDHGHGLLVEQGAVLAGPGGARIKPVMNEYIGNILYW